jgi:hypothetical protein
MMYRLILILGLGVLACNKPSVQEQPLQVSDLFLRLPQGSLEPLADLGLVEEGDLGLLLEGKTSLQLLQKTVHFLEFAFEPPAQVSLPNALPRHLLPASGRLRLGCYPQHNGNWLVFIQAEALAYQPPLSHLPFNHLLIYKTLEYEPHRQAWIEEVERLPRLHYRDLWRAWDLTPVWFQPHVQGLLIDYPRPQMVQEAQEAGVRLPKLLRWRGYLFESD